MKVFWFAVRWPTQHIYYAGLIVDFIGYISEMSQSYSGDDGAFCDCCYKLPVEKVKSSFHCISILNGLCIAFVGVMEIWAFGLNWTANDDVCKSSKCCLKWITFF